MELSEPPAIMNVGDLKTFKTCYHSNLEYQIYSKIYLRNITCHDSWDNEKYCTIYINN